MNDRLTVQMIRDAMERVRTEGYKVCAHAVHPRQHPRILPPDRYDEAVEVVPCAMLCGHSFLLGPEAS